MDHAQAHLYFWKTDRVFRSYLTDLHIQIRPHETNIILSSASDYFHGRAEKYVAIIRQTDLYRFSPLRKI